MAICQYVAPCHFGLESVLSGELKRMGASDVMAQDGKVFFSGDYNILARANINLRTAERVLILLSKFKATSFEELFQGVIKIPFEDYIGSKDAFPVKGWSINSKLFSISDCQSIIKKAAVERLKKHYHIDWFVETGVMYQLQFSIHKDEVLILLDTSGASLHKRGYRENSNQAPIKETLAAGIIDIARVKGGSVVYDPFCGSGTFLIESAMKAFNIPPCLKRKFAGQYFSFIDEKIWKDERARGIELIKKDVDFFGYGYDIDNDAVELTKFNARKAGVLSKLYVSQRDIRDFEVKSEFGTILANPPYGERLLDANEANELYTILGHKTIGLDKFSSYIISPYDKFEQLYGRAATKRRKLYNGMLKCQLYMYF